MVVTQRRLTAEEYLALPPEPNTQLIDGEVVVNDPSFRHQRISVELFRLLANWLLANPGLGEAGMGCNILIDERNVFVADAWFVAEARRPGRDARNFEGPPDLVVEVRAPSTWRYDVGKKKDAYQRAGCVPERSGGEVELWLVDTESDTVLVFRGTEALEVGRGEQLTTPLLPGFALDLADLFDR
jgi:Uma2 family endonuclease